MKRFRLYSLVLATVLLLLGSKPANADTSVSNPSFGLETDVSALAGLLPSRRRTVAKTKLYKRNLFIHSPWTQTASSLRSIPDCTAHVTCQNSILSALFPNCHKHFKINKILPYSQVVPKR